MLMKEKRKRKFTRQVFQSITTLNLNLYYRSGNEADDESTTAKTSIATRPHGPYPTIIISSNETRSITKITF